jgi:hypothetical protein
VRKDDLRALLRRQEPGPAAFGARNCQVVFGEHLPGQSAAFTLSLLFGATISLAFTDPTDTTCMLA